MAPLAESDGEEHWNPFSIDASSTKLLLSGYGGTEVGANWYATKRTSEDMEHYPLSRARALCVICDLTVLVDRVCTLRDSDN